MLQHASLYAQYGTGMAFALSLDGDGSFLFSLQGNSHPLFPPLEMGEYQGVDPPRILDFLARMEAALPSSKDNARPQPGSAFLAVRTGKGDGHVFDLYDVPAPLAPVFADLLSWVNGPGRAFRKNTMAIEAQFAARQFHAGLGPQCRIEFRCTSSAGLGFSCPRPDTFELVLANAAANADSEDYVQLLGPDLGLDFIPSQPPPAVKLAFLGPGLRLTVMLTTSRPLTPGTYTGRLLYRSYDADLHGSHVDGVSGCLQVELGTVQILPPKG